MVQETEFRQIIKELNSTGTGRYSLRGRRTRNRAEIHYYVTVHDLEWKFSGVELRKRFPDQVYRTSGGGTFHTFRLLTPEQKLSGDYEGWFR